MSNDFRITGSVSEKESGLGISGLVVKAVDEHGLADDALGSAITSNDGSFEITYCDQDLTELGGARPNIYLVVYQQPLRHLLDSQNRVRWGARPEERFDIEIPRRILGAASPSALNDRVEGGIRLSAKRLVVEHRKEFDLPILPGFQLRGPPGAPALPQLVQHVALPAGAQVIRLEVSPGEAVLVPGPVNPMPIQSSFFDVETTPGRAYEVAALWMPQLTRLDTRYQVAGARYPADLASIGRTRRAPGIDFVEVKVSPVEYEPGSRTYLFYPKLRYTVIFAPRPDSASAAAPQIDRHRAQMLSQILASRLVNAAPGLRPFSTPPSFPRGGPGSAIPHLIITDAVAWPTERHDCPPGYATPSRPPYPEEAGPELPKGPSQESLVSEFSRLAEWKSRRGVASRVVTVSDILSGKAGGDFTSNAVTGQALDLQEVIRNFIKFAYRQWQTTYVLLGGDIHVVPIRRLTGYVALGPDPWDCARTADNPPSRRKCFIQQNGYAKLHIDPGLFDGKTPLEITPLCAQRSGTQIPFRSLGPESGPHWFFVDQDQFEGLSDDFSPLDYGQRSNYVIVRGPQKLIDDDYYWIRESRRLASDLYYACVHERYSYAGYHDFDTNRNGYYGQFRFDGELRREVPLSLPNGEPNFDADNPNIFVGRAPVSSWEQARNFVDKVITYESLSATDGAPVPLGYLNRRLYAADYHMHNACSPSKDWKLGDPIDGERMKEGEFISDPERGFAFLVRPPGLWQGESSFFASEGQNTVARWRLIARHPTADALIPMQDSAKHTQAGGGLPYWYFADRYGTSQQPVSDLRYVRIEGASQDVAPGDFLWDPISVEDQFQKKEDTRHRMDEMFPGFPESECERYYADHFELSSPPHIAAYRENAVITALKAGPHFVSMSAHGSWGGLGGIGVGDVEHLGNRDRYFIAFAKSCSTAKTDASDAGSCPADGQHETRGSGEFHVASAELGSTSCGYGGWRYCTKCKSLVSGDNSGVCCEGGQHDTRYSWKYSLPLAVAENKGQSNWRLCKKCQTLVFGGSAGVCAAGGYHDSAQSPVYSLWQVSDASRQSGWCWCRKCQGLHFCQTRQRESFGETLVTQRHGAVAYVGFTEMAPFETNVYEDNFWTLAASLGRLGPAAGLHGAVSAPDKLMMWSSFGQILYGDPEMPVWTHLPKSYSVSHPSIVEFGQMLPVGVSDSGGHPIGGQCVTLIGDGSIDGSKWLQSKETNAQGKTSFVLPSRGPFSEVVLTVSDGNAPPRFKPYVGRMRIRMAI